MIIASNGSDKILVVLDDELINVLKANVPTGIEMDGIGFSIVFVYSPNIKFVEDNWKDGEGSMSLPKAVEASWHVPQEPVSNDVNLNEALSHVFGQPVELADGIIVYGGVEKKDGDNQT